MSKPQFTQAELEAYLDETLDVERMVQIEKALRKEPRLLEHLTQINVRRDTGVHTLAEIWRRHQIGVPTREDLGKYLLGILPPEQADYIRFRVEKLRCRFTIANLQDLKAQQQELEAASAARRRKYFQSSVGRLRERD
jgi:hypothetical protein